MSAICKRPPRLYDAPDLRNRCCLRGHEVQDTIRDQDVNALVLHGQRRGLPFSTSNISRKARSSQRETGDEGCRAVPYPKDARRLVIASGQPVHESMRSCSIRVLTNDVAGTADAEHLRVACALDHETLIFAFSRAKEASRTDG